MFDKLSGVENRYIELEKFLSDDYIQKQIEITKKQKEKEDMFK